MCSAQLHSATPIDSRWKRRPSREIDGRNNITFNRNRECCASVTLKTRKRIVSSSFFFSYPFSVHAIAARVSMLPPDPCRSITNNFANIFDPSTGHLNSRHSMTPFTSIASRNTDSVLHFSRKSAGDMEHFWRRLKVEIA